MKKHILPSSPVVAYCLRRAAIFNNGLYNNNCQFNNCCGGNIRGTIGNSFFNKQSFSFQNYSTFPTITLSEDQVNDVNNGLLGKTSQELGRRFETQVVEYLVSMYDFDLTVTKRSHDQGIDFKGFWNFPYLKKVNPHPIPILGQCKREKDAVGVKYIREFEGVLSHYQLQKSTTTSTTTTGTTTGHHGGGEQNVVGIFVSHSGFSEHAVRQALDSKQPIILVILTTIMNNDDKNKLHMTYFYMNHAAQSVIPKVSTSIERAVDGNNSGSSNRIIFSIDN